MSRRRSSIGVSSVASMNNDVSSPNSSADSIKVLCRFRPPTQNRDSFKPGSKQYQLLDAYKIDEQRNEIEFSSDLSEGKSFTFDKVFGADSTQSDVFKELSGVVTSVMDGFNGTIMAYGQTSAGKSHTMEGLSLWDPESQGVIPRCIDTLFEEIAKADSMIQFQVVLSFYEIYCEKIRDLLNPQQINLKIRETRNNGFIVQDVTEVYCTDRESVLRVIEVGKANRVTAPTLMNAESSRSHSIVSILIDQKNLQTGRNKRGVLFLVDLAGSEKVSKTGASGMRLEEAKNINSSLTTLGMVINALCDGSSHVPYRDSKLTMILTDALGGNSKTTLIICCNPDMRHIPETLSTLRFGERAKRIKNNARINEEFSVEELKSMLQTARKEIVQLKNRLRLSDLPTDIIPISSQTTDTGSNDDDSIANRALLKDSEFISSRDEEQKVEIQSLRAKILALEEELETEKIRNKEEHELRILITTEAEALKNTIVELEEKLLKIALSKKSRQSIDANGNESSPGIMIERNRTKSSASLKVSSSDSAAGHLPEKLSDLSNPTVKNGHLHSKQQHQDHNHNHQSNGHITPEEGEHRDYEEEENDDEEDSEAFEYEPRQQRGNSIQELNKHGLYLNSQLENEIRGLSRTISDQQNETKNAHQSAQQYAEKYIKLREEYELHVQVLMLKLTQEQQARTVIEDKLEDAYVKLWQQSTKKRKSKGFFATWFGSKEKGGELSPVSSKMLPPHLADVGFNDHDQTISRKLEISQSRVSQLVAELEATKEAQMIVLETKEAVMRSLARQNSQLTMEKDSLNRRVEEMTNTIDQLTNLLRNVQQRAVRDHAAQSRSTNPNGNNSIKGGHRNSRHSKDQNQDKNFLIDQSHSSEDENRNIEVIL